jgi:uncharacterized protein YbaR (Trm112 family)
MTPDLLELLRCPYCGGRLALVDTLFHERESGRIQTGILGCHCCIFPVVAGIPVLHLQAPAIAAREHVEAGRAEAAFRAMVGLPSDADADRFEALVASPDATYAQCVDALGPAFEGRYFLFRFSDPTYVVGEALVHAVADVVLPQGGRAVDICGGSGHLTRVLSAGSRPAPVLADLYFAKAWLAQRFTSPGCEAVCCDGNAPLPFARGAFKLALCSDAFQYIWTKRQFVAEMIRLIEGPAGGTTAGAVVINHTHNQLAWSPSHGQPLTPDGYRDLFETLEPRLFGEAGLFEDVVDHGRIDLSRRSAEAALNGDPALAIVASRHPDVFQLHPIVRPARRGELRINPLYAQRQTAEGVELQLAFPSKDYEEEYGACRRYLPGVAHVSAATLDGLAGGPPTAELADLLRRRVVLDLPVRYY